MVAEGGSGSRSIPARHVAAVVAGNALEFYDFTTYAYFAVYIGRTYFPSTDASASLLASLGTFGAGFLTRPLGGLILGRMGDRLGRKPAMILCFWLMGISIAGLALTPTYKMIGALAPALIVFFRLLQGFALGGDVGPSMAFLLESAPPERRGFYTALQLSSQFVASLASGIVGFALASSLSERHLQDFGWRIAFLLGAAIVPFGLWLRRVLPETLPPARGTRQAPLQLRPYLPVAVIGLILMASAMIGRQIQIYMTIYALTTLHLPAKVAFAVTIAMAAAGAVFSLVSGEVSDRVGRKPVIAASSVLLLALVYPGFYVMVHSRTTAAFLGVTTVLAILVSLMIPAVIVWLSESVPAGVRSGAIGVLYGFSVAIFGGTTQYAVAWLIHRTGSALVPAWYWTAAMLIALPALLMMRESKPASV